MRIFAAILLCLAFALAACTPAEDRGADDPATQPTATARLGDDGDDDGDTDDTGDGVTHSPDPTPTGSPSGDATGTPSGSPSASPTN